MKKYFEIAIDESLKSLKSKDVPVGAIIVKNNKIISKAHNTREKKKNVINHAECLAIFKAAKKLKSWNLNDCEMYTTLKPCSMCEAIINNSKIKKVYYLLDKPKSKMEYKTEFIHAQTIVCNDVCENYNKMLSDFFYEIRKK